MAVLSRTEAVRRLYDDTLLPPTTIVGTFGILDKADCALTLDNVLAAAWTAYKTYETHVSQKLSYFRGLAPNAEADLRVAELRVLGALGWAVPARTRVHAVDDLAYKLDLTKLDYGRASVLSLVLPECARMTDEQYARVVLCAAAQLAKLQDMQWAARLASDDVGVDYIMTWGVRVACVSGPSSGVKRKRT